MSPAIEMASAEDIALCLASTEDIARCRVAARPARLRVTRSSVADNAKGLQHRRNNRECLCRTCESERKWERIWTDKHLADPDYYGLRFEFSSPLRDI